MLLSWMNNMKKIQIAVSKFLRNCQKTRKIVRSICKTMSTTTSLSVFNFSPKTFPFSKISITITNFFKMNQKIVKFFNSRGIVKFNRHSKTKLNFDLYLSRMSFLRDTFCFFEFAKKIIYSYSLSKISFSASCFSYHQHVVFKFSVECVFLFSLFSKIIHIRTISKKPNNKTIIFCL